MKLSQSKGTIWMISLLLAEGVFAQAPPSLSTPGSDAKLAAYFDALSYSVTIEQRIADATKANAGQKPNDIVIQGSSGERFVDHGSPLARQTKLPPLLLSAVANSDLVVMGTVLTSRSLATNDHTFVFTEYTVRVDRVFFDKTNSVSPLQTIIVSREGGSVAMDGVLVKAVAPDFEQFSPNQQYVFALKSLPGTDAYKAVAPWTYEVANGLVLSASKLETKTERRKTLPEFISDLEAAVAYRH